MAIGIKKEKTSYNKHTKVDLLRLVAEAEIKEALLKCIKITNDIGDTERNENLIILQSRHTKLENRIRLGRIYEEHRNVEFNDINWSLTNIINELDIETGIKSVADVEAELKIVKTALSIEKKKNKLKQNLIDNFLQNSISHVPYITKGKKVTVLIIGEPTKGINQLANDFENRYLGVNKFQVSTSKDLDEFINQRTILDDYLIVIYSSGNKKIERSNLLHVGDELEFSIKLESLIYEFSECNTLYIIDSNLAPEEFEFESFKEMSIAMILSNNEKTSSWTVTDWTYRNEEGALINGLTKFLSETNYNISAPLFFHLFIDYFNSSIIDANKQVPLFWCTEKFNMIISMYNEWR